MHPQGLVLDLPRGAAHAPPPVLSVSYPSYIHTIVPNVSPLANRHTVASHREPPILTVGGLVRESSKGRPGPGLVSGSSGRAVVLRRVSGQALP